MISLLKYTRGDIVTYRTFGGGEREVAATDRLGDVKNGQPGFDGHLVGDPRATVWGYDDQIITISRRT